MDKEDKLATDTKECNTNDSTCHGDSVNNSQYRSEEVSQSCCSNGKGMSKITDVDKSICEGDSDKKAQTVSENESKSLIVIDNSTTMSTTTIQMCADNFDLVFKCDLCDRKFGRNVVLQGHKRAVHNVEEIPTCNICNKT